MAAFSFIVISVLLLCAWTASGNIVVNHIIIRNESLSYQLQGRVIAQVSDLHLDRELMLTKDLMRILQDISPDILFLTGDYVNWKGDYGPAISFLSQLNFISPVYAVMGDYDYSNSRKSCLFCHDESTGLPNKGHSIRFLRNSVERINVPGWSAWIGGIDAEGEDPLSLQGSLAFLKGKEPAIVLSHSPLVFDFIDDEQDVFVLAGDTHGGQIPLPSWLWSILGYEKNAKYEKGWFEKGKKKMYVNRGVGTSHFPIRFMRSPEITIFHFQSPENEVH